VTAFLWWFRDEPARHPAVNAAELGVITGETVDVTLPARYEPIPWGRVLTNRNIWLLGTSTTCGAFTTYLFFSWYPTYLQEGRGLGNIGSGWLTSLVLGAGAVGILCGGVLADLATRFRWDRVRCRRIQGVTAFVLAATSMLASSLAEDPYLSAGYAAGACLFLLAQQAIWWSSATEVSGRHVGALFGLMNGMGVFGAMASQLFFGAFTEWRRDLGYTGREVAEPAFYVYVAVLLVGACCWLFIDPTRRVGHEQEGTADAARDA
jgi:sugar phosphate permease